MSQGAGPRGQSLMCFHLCLGIYPQTVRTQSLRLSHQPGNLLKPHPCPGIGK